MTFLASCQSALIYYPRAYDKATLDAFARLGGRQVEADTSQGRQLAFYLPAQRDPSQPPEFLWLVTGGNAALALDYLADAAGWDRRAGFLFVDYPGYGRCPGRPNPATIEESVLALARKLQSELGWTDDDLRRRTGAFGHSIGCAAALMAADGLQLRRVVLCAPFTTMTDLARRVVGWPLCLLNRHRFDNVARLDRLSTREIRVRIFHGTEDEIVPVAMGRTLAAKFPGNTRLTEVRGSHHNDIVTNAAAELGAAIRELTPPTPR